MTCRTNQRDGVVSQMGRVRQWCLANPGETLSPSDLRTKFGASGEQMKVIVRRLRAEGLLDVELVYLAKKPAANDEKRKAA